MTRQVTIPFPEGLDGDYASPGNRRPGAPPQGVAGARARPDDAEAIRAFRESLLGLGPTAAACTPPAEPTLHTVEFLPIAA